MSRARIRRVATDELTTDEIAVIRALMVDAFGTDEEEAFTDDDWDHAVGGVHFILDVAGRIVAHASIVERELQVAGRPFRTGYVEAVATAPEQQGAGFGSRLMEAVSAHIRERFELGALGTGRHHFYERLGWRAWLGPSSVREHGSQRPTPDDDGFILVLATPTSPALDLTASISCDWRAGAVW